MRPTLLCLMFALCPLAWGQNEDLNQRVRRDLQSWYADRAKAPPYASTVAHLQDADPATRRRASDYLTALLRQLWQDETGGNSPLRASPFWGAGATVDAREYRQMVAGELGQNGAGEEALEPAEFLLQNDLLDDVQASAVRVLHRVPCQRSSALALRMLAQPHPNQAVLVTALQMVGERELQEALPQVQALAHHHRARVREQAVKTAQKLGQSASNTAPEVLPPDLEQQLQSIESMVLYPEGSLPDSARWVHIQAPAGQLTIASSWFGNEDLKEVSGWLLDENQGQLHVLDTFGSERWLKASACKLTSRNFDQEIEALIAARSQPGDPLYQQFRPSWLILPEATTAAWALRRGQRRAAARLILSRLQETPDDRWLLWAARDLLGHRYHQRMLDAFCYRRDYAKASKLAHHLAQACFQGYPYQARAQELEQQLVARNDDFRRLQLPTPAQWDKLRHQLDRPAQIRYMADRLRLLTCRQWGQPGGISFSDQQSNLPDANGAENYVLNPLTTLAEMKLTRADCAELLPYLEDRNFVLGYSFFRDFHPSRSMHRVGELVCLLLNGAAGKELVQPAQLEREPDRRAAVERVRAWCQAGRQR